MPPGMLLPKMSRALAPSCRSSSVRPTVLDGKNSPSSCSLSGVEAWMEAMRHTPSSPTVQTALTRNQIRASAPSPG